MSRCGHSTKIRINQDKTVLNIFFAFSWQKTCKETTNNTLTHNKASRVQCHFSDYIVLCFPCIAFIRVMAMISVVFLGFAHEQGPAEDLIVSTLTTIHSLITVDIIYFHVKLFFSVLREHSRFVQGTSKIIVNTHYTLSYT